MVRAPVEGGEIDFGPRVNSHEFYNRPTTEQRRIERTGFQRLRSLDDDPADPAFSDRSTTLTQS
jgi:hypothetical protein